jgi:hypothetical protein
MPFRKFSTSQRQGGGVIKTSRGDELRQNLLDGDGVLVALGAFCSTLLVAAVATAFVSVGCATLVLLGWLGMFALACLTVCSRRLRRGR